MTANTLPTKRRYWLLTSPRTASNLLIRMLNLDEQGVPPARNGGYFFMPYMASRVELYHKPVKEWTPEEAADNNSQGQACFNALQDYIEAAEASGQKIYVKEHVDFLNSSYTEVECLFDIAVERKGPDSMVQPMRGSTVATQSALNMTCLPDEFLKTWHPTFLIRHPAMTIPSLYRTAMKDVSIGGSKRLHPEPYDFEVKSVFNRRLYDFYLDHFGKDSEWPMVIDADDMMACPELVRKYAGLVGLDADKIRLSWDAVSPEKLTAPQKIMLGHINASTGVDKGKMAGKIDIDAEAVKWRIEFGEERGRIIEQWVRDSMPDYEYIRARRLRLD